MAVSLMDIKNDKLYIYKAAEEVHAVMVGLSNVEFMSEQQDSETKMSKKTLKYFYDKAKEVGVNAELILGWNNHAGYGICEAVKEKNITTLVVGRRDIGSLTRMFIGSTTKYCLENADCNVVIAKKRFGPIEEHSPLSKVKELEEEERQRRIKEEKDKIAAEEKERTENLESVHKAEEEERSRRVKSKDTENSFDEDDELLMEIFQWNRYY
eukprot:CAMPEP_0168528104 /NCGR_PEP_ID=MMETSP0405-20121227/13051_1 /TAXON_ID=498012 /ORGANISM="Trichosphaerium sp, Strain Am-I-7 wt" /LENGTH=210 /DNA_ID=CAMNT_0008551447 /DNA_START=639 /DNA_END=1271 /DNA_ORIENTATION=-